MGGDIRNGGKHHHIFTSVYRMDAFHYASVSHLCSIAWLTPTGVSSEVLQTVYRRDFLCALKQRDVTQPSEQRFKGKLPKVVWKKD